MRSQTLKDAEQRLEMILTKILAHFGRQAGHSQVSIPGNYSNELSSAHWEWSQCLEMEDAGKL